MVEDVAPPRDDREVYEDRPAPKAKRSTAMRLVAVAVVALVAIGIALLAYTVSSTTTVTTSAPALNEEGAAPGTVPAGETANVTPVVREINIDGSSHTPDPASAPAATAAPSAAPPAPRVRPEPPASAANAVEPDFDQAAPLAPAEAPLTATAPGDAASDDAFISLIERTLAESGGGAPQPPALSPATEPGLLVTPQGNEEFPIPPENVPMVDGEGQPLTLPQDFLIDTE
jgi:type IV secretory pathway VirB10-like protein